MLAVAVKAVGAIPDLVERESTVAALERLIDEAIENQELGEAEGVHDHDAAPPV
jgi:hypothetical protein